MAPTTGASIHPARTIGPMIVQQIAGGAVTWEQLPVYLIAALLAGAVAGIANPLITPDPEDTAAASTDAPGILAQAAEAPAAI